MNPNNLVKLPQGVSDFKKLVEGNYKFIDKTLFIKDIIYDGSEVIVITRPRRFGKTLNLSMLYHFLKYQDEKEQGENLFKGLEISKHKDFCANHQNQHPVIFISFKDVKENSFDRAYTEIVEIIRRLYEEHKYLLEGNILSEGEKKIYLSLLRETADRKNITGAILLLSKHMQGKFKQEPIILIDEYDTPIQEAYLKGYYEEMVDLMRSIFGKSLKDNRYLRKGIVTGITRISQESLFSGVNNLGVRSMFTRQYGQYFGFLEEEVIKLISETSCKISIDAIREWYNGYQIYDYTLYNPWSIISCLINDGELKPYWLNTSSNALLKSLLVEAPTLVKHKLEILLQGETIEQSISENLIFTEIKTQSDALWNLLLSAGYLKVLSTKFNEIHGLIAKIAIPNKEVAFAYNKIIENWIDSAFGSESYNEFVQSLHDGDLEKFKDYLSNYLVQTGSYFDFSARTSEQTFHVFILGLVFGLRQYYHIYSNRESGLGRFDMIFIPKNKEHRGIILEFKNSENSKMLKSKAKQALAQIKENNYIEEFKQHKIDTVFAIGLAFCGKEINLSHEEIKIPRNSKS